MDNFDRLQAQLRLRLIGFIIIGDLFAVGLYILLLNFTDMSGHLAAGIGLGAATVFGLIAMQIGIRLAIQPIRALWQTVLHLSPQEQGVAAPKPEDLKVGKELVVGLSAQIYQLASTAQSANTTAAREAQDLSHSFIAQNLPLPFLVLDSKESIKFANDAAAAYIGMKAQDIIGKNVYMVLDMSFPSESTFDKWLKNAKLQNATAAMSWERVRLNVRDDHPVRMFDLAAYYNRDNPDDNTTMLVLFDHTKQYSQDDQAVSFIALSVHELRTPLTLLRGYMEVFEEEVNPTLQDPELRDFMLKMQAMSDQLTAFVNNILNVARVDDDQLELELQSEDWSTILKSSLELMSLRARVRGITLHCRIASGLPPVGVDRLSIREVIANLIDNAIKYSGNSKVIDIDTRLTQEGLIETTVQDHGLGIPTSILPNLFTKFYRDHRNRAQIGGTGLGLYLSKAIITAHGGNLWVRSKEGEGSTFGFTLIPYEKLTEEMKQNGNTEITRGAHGWIKNHSLYRR